MKKKLFMLMFMLFVPRVYAFTYDLGTEVVSTSNTDNSLYEIKVSLKDIKDSDYGIAACSLNINFYGGVKLNSAVRSVGSWTLTQGKFYLFDTGNGVHDDAQFFVIPVKVEDKGRVEIVDIECFDDETAKKIDNKVISLEKKNSSTVDNSNNNKENNSSNNSIDGVLDSNCDLENIILSEGTIDFSSSVTDYYIKASSIDDLLVFPIPVSDKAKYTVLKDNNKLSINVLAQDGTEKVYTIYVSVSDKKKDNENKDNNYVPIFIGIICILVLINVFRIIKNMKK